MEGRDREAAAAEEEDARRWMAASSLTTAGREPEADAGEAEKGESISSAARSPSRSTSISSASRAATGEVAVEWGIGEGGGNFEFCGGEMK